MIDLTKDKKELNTDNCDWFYIWQYLLSRLELPQNFVELLTLNSSAFFPRTQEIKPRVPENAMAHSLWIFREDENGGLLGGAKTRKWHGIVSWCQSERVNFVSLAGGKSSANVLLGLLALKEAGIPCCWLSQSAHSQSSNRRFSAIERLLEAMALSPLQSEDEMERLREQRGAQKFLALKEGSYHVSAVAGLLSLVAQLSVLIRREHYTDLLIESGSGLSALTCVLGFAALSGSMPEFTVHILHVAGSEASLEAQLNAICTPQSSDFRHVAQADPDFWISLQKLNVNVGDLPRRRHHLPRTAKSFGSVNAAVRKTSEYYLRNCGIICDPVYTAKTLMLAEELMANQDSSQVREAMKLLVLNGGGAINLLGFLPSS